MLEINFGNEAKVANDSIASFNVERNDDDYSYEEMPDLLSIRRTPIYQKKVIHRVFNDPMLNTTKTLAYKMI